METKSSSNTRMIEMSENDFDDSFTTFANNIEKAIDTMHPKDFINTKRKGLRGFRDKIVSGKVMWAEAISYLGIFSAIISAIALIPLAINNANMALKPFGIHFPVLASSYLAFAMVVFLLIFGFLSYRVFGTARRNDEIRSKMSSCDFVEWKEIRLLRKELHEFKLESQKRK